MPSDPQIKNLPVAPEVRLFRVLDAVIRADPTVKAAVKVFRSWQGHATDKNPPTSGQLPFVRLTPRASPEQPWAPETQIGTLFIDVEIVVESFCSDDIMNLWYAIQLSVNPPTAAVKNPLVKRLQDAHAHKGLVYFSAPAFDKDGGADGQFSAVAGMKIEYRKPMFS